MTRRGRGAIPALACALVLGGCDGRYESRQAIANEATGPAAEALRGKVTAAVLAHARAEGIPCPAQDGFLLHCHRQPIHVTVQDTGGRIDVCYSARGARFESGKFERRMADLARRVDAAVGRPVARTLPEYPACPLR